MVGSQHDLPWWTNCGCCKLNWQNMTRLKHLASNMENQLQTVHLSIAMFWSYVYTSFHPGTMLSTKTWTLHSSFWPGSVDCRWSKFLTQDGFTGKDVFNILYVVCFKWFTEFVERQRWVGVPQSVTISKTVNQTQLSNSEQHGGKSHSFLDIKRFLCPWRHGLPATRRQKSFRKRFTRMPRSSNSRSETLVDLGHNCDNAHFRYA